MNKSIDVNSIFKIGEVVIDKSGSIGYVKSICHCEHCMRRKFFEPIIHWVTDEDGKGCKDETDREEYFTVLDARHLLCHTTNIKQVGKFEVDKYEFHFPDYIRPEADSQNTVSYIGVKRYEMETNYPSVSKIDLNEFKHKQSEIDVLKDKFYPKDIINLSNVEFDLIAWTYYKANRNRSIRFDPVFLNFAKETNNFKGCCGNGYTLIDILKYGQARKWQLTEAEINLLRCMDKLGIKKLCEVYDEDTFKRRYSANFYNRFKNWRIGVLLDTFEDQLLVKY